MANSLYQQLMTRSPSSNPQPQMDDQVKQLFNSVKSSANPMASLNMLAQQNPKLGQIMQMVTMSGKHPKDLFYMYAQQMGIDPNTILSNLTKL